MEVRRNEPLTGLEVGVNMRACKGKQYIVSRHPTAGYLRLQVPFSGPPPRTLVQRWNIDSLVVGMAVMAHVECPSLRSKLT